MIITKNSNINSLIIAAGLSIGCSSVTSSFAQQNIYIIDIDSKKIARLGASQNYDASFGLNDAGQVVGTLDKDTGHMRAFITGPNGADMSILGIPNGAYGGVASGINDAGQVMGHYSTTDSQSYATDSQSYGVGAVNATFSSTTHGYITGPNGIGMTEIETLGQGRFNDNSPTDINNSGQVVGYTFASHAFITGPNGVGITDLGTLGGYGSRAYAVNNTGQVVGSSSYTVAADNQHAFITGPNGTGMVDLGTLGGSQSFALGINDWGQVVGGSTTSTGDWHAFVTGPNGVGMTDLGALGGIVSIATDINNAGQVVGYLDTAAGAQHAFITGPNGMGMTDLNSILSLPNGEIANGPIRINNHGQIVAMSVASAVPEPETYTMILAGVGLIGFILRRRQLLEEPGLASVCSS